MKGGGGLGILEYKCKLCGAPLESFKEMGKYAAACTHGDCIGCFDYELFDTQQELLETLEAGE